MRNENLGFLFGDRRCGLWSTTELGHSALSSVSDLQFADELGRVIAQPGLVKRGVPLRVACYRLLVWLLVEERERGQVMVIRRFEWRRELQPSEQARTARKKLPAAAYVSPKDAPNPALNSTRRLLLLPDLGTAPVAHYREVLRRVFSRNEQIASSVGARDELVIATVDPDGAGARSAAWCSLLAQVARSEQAEPVAFRVVSWAQVVARLSGSARSAAIGAHCGGKRATRRRSSSRDHVLHLLGRHPLLTVGQLALLLETTCGRIERFEQEMLELGLLRRIDPCDLSGTTLKLEWTELAHLGLVELTHAGRRRLADALGLDTGTASRYHGLFGSGRSDAVRRRQFLRTLAHTVGANDVFVAFAVASAAGR